MFIEGVIKNTIVFRAYFVIIGLIFGILIVLFLFF